MYDELPKLSKKEHLILELLITQGEAYGLQLVKAAPNDLKRGTVYVTLGRMADKGYVASRQVKEPGEKGLPKRLFRPTGHGRRVFQAWAMAKAVMEGGLAPSLGGA